MATRTKKPDNTTDFVVFEEHENGTVTWQHPQSGETILMNAGTIPSQENLRVLAAHGIVPKLPRSNDFDDTDEYPADEPQESALDRVLAEFQQDGFEGRAEVKIYRVRDDGTEVYCGMFSPEEFESKGLELVRYHWGGGKFRVRVMATTPKDGRPNGGKFVRRTNQLVEIESAIVPVKTGDSQTGSNDQMAAMLLSRLDRLESRGIAGGAAPDLLQQIEMFAKLQSIMGGREKPKSIVEQLAELEALKKFKDENLGTSSNGDSEPGMMQLAMKGLELIQTGVQKAPQVAMQPQQMPSVALPETFAQAAPQTETVNQGETVNIGENFMLNVMLGALIKAAERGESIDVHASGLAEKLPDEVLDMLELPIWFDSLLQIAPAYAAAIDTHRTWFTALRDKIIEIANTPEPE